MDAAVGDEAVRQWFPIPQYAGSASLKRGRFIMSPLFVCYTTPHLSLDGIHTPCKPSSPTADHGSQHRLAFTWNLQGCPQKYST